MKLKVRAWNGEQIVSPDYVDRDGVARWKENSIPTYSEDIMLWTGLKDDYGEELFEHDIIVIRWLFCEGPSIIVYVPPRFIAVKHDQLEFALKQKEMGFGNTWYKSIAKQASNPWKQIQKIGNIYEDPDLVKPCNRQKLSWLCSEEEEQKACKTCTLLPHPWRDYVKEYEDRKKKK